MNCCTICGLRTTLSGTLHYANGRTFRWAEEPVGHHASTDPRFLVLRLRFTGAWAPAEAAAPQNLSDDDRDAFPSMRAFLWWAQHLPWAAEVAADAG